MVLYNPKTASMFQGCLIAVFRVCQGCTQGILRVFYICFQGVFGCFKACARVFQVYFKGALKGVFKAFQLKKVSV